MEPGDLLAIFSEGIAATLSDARVLDIVSANLHAGAAELTRRVFEEAERSTNRPWLDEDRTFAAVRVVGACERPVLEESAEQGLLVFAA